MLLLLYGRLLSPSTHPPGARPCLISPFAGTRVPVLLLVFGHLEAAEACQPPFPAAGRLGLKDCFERSAVLYKHAVCLDVVATAGLEAPPSSATPRQFDRFVGSAASQQCHKTRKDPTYLFVALNTVTALASYRSCDAGSILPRCT